MRNVTLAATQMACTWDGDETIARAEALVRQAAGQGAQVILLQELFQAPYFCITLATRHLALARTPDMDRGIAHFRALARELGVVLPISFYEEAGQARYNSVAMIDADGEVLGIYRKTHIPHSAGYEEKFYFSPGDTGFRVFETRFGRIGMGICWDQWFPETARALALRGAEILLFPTAIGSEPEEPAIDSAGHWQRVMQGHAGANIMPLVASNRIGTEREGAREMTFYGSSFIADHTGAKVAEAGRDEAAVLTATFDLDAVAEYRRNWGVFRDRRPEAYGALMTLDGHIQGAWA